MAEIQKITRFDLETKLTLQEIRVTQLIALVMVMMVILFSIILLFLYSQRSAVLPVESAVPENNIVPILSLLLLVLAVVEYAIAYILPKIMFSPPKLKIRLSEPFAHKQDRPISELIQVLVGIYRVRLIIILAILEGVALFGLVVLFLAITQGIIYENNNYWLNFVPALILLIYAIKNFPNKERMIEYIEKQILNPLQSIF